MTKNKTITSNRGAVLERSEDLRLLLLKREHTKSELADLLGVNKRTITRYLTVLSSHHTVAEEQRGKEMAYWIEGSEKPNFTPTELAVLVLARESIAATARTLGPPFDRSFDGLERKIGGSLPEELRRKYQAMSSIFGSALLAVKDFSKFGDVIENLTTAAAECRRVRMEYASFDGDSMSVRLFEPFSVYFDPDGGTIKTLGFDHKRGGIIPFSIDHVRKIDLLEEFFERPSDFNLKTFLERNCFNGIHGTPVTVRLRAFAGTAKVFAERRFHPSQVTIEPLAGTRGGESITIELTVAGGRGLVRFILSWMPEIEVLAPESVRGEVGKALRKGLVKHEKDAV